MEKFIPNFILKLYIMKIMQELKPREPSCNLIFGFLVLIKLSSLYMRESHTFELYMGTVVVGLYQCGESQDYS